MKTFFLFLVAAVVSTNAVAQAAGTEIAKEVLVLKENSFDFGKIPQGKPVTHAFDIVNQSSDSITLQSVQASCGCTTPSWKREPIAPGASATITVGYNAAAEGLFEKPVTILYPGGPKKVFTIRGTVVKGPANTAPANASIQSLKQTNQ